MATCAPEAGNNISTVAARNLAISSVHHLQSVMMKVQLVCKNEEVGEPGLARRPRPTAPWAVNGKKTPITAARRLVIFVAKEPKRVQQESSNVKRPTSVLEALTSAMDPLQLVTPTGDQIVLMAQMRMFKCAANWENMMLLIAQERSQSAQRENGPVIMVNALRPVISVMERD